MEQTFIGNGQRCKFIAGEPLCKGGWEPPLINQGHQCISRRFLACPGETAMAADDTCSTISNSAATRAASRFWSGFSHAGAAPRGRARTVSRPASTISINQPATRPHTESLDRPRDLAGSRRGPLDQASGCADDQPGQKGRRPKAGSLPLCAGLPCSSSAFCGACELGKLDTSVDLASAPGSSLSRVSVWSYAVTLTPFAMPLNCRGKTARRKG